MGEVVCLTDWFLIEAAASGAHDLCIESENPLASMDALLVWGA
jgi:hypothetical protein